VFDLYGAAHALMVGSMVAGIVAVLWLVFRACHNYFISSNQLYASRHRRARLLVSAPSFVLVVALFFGGLTWFIGQTRVSKTTVGAIVDQGRTVNEAGLRTEAEVFGTTVSTIVYYRLRVDSPVVNWLNQTANISFMKRKTWTSRLRSTATSTSPPRVPQRRRSIEVVAPLRLSCRRQLLEPTSTLSAT